MQFVLCMYCQFMNKKDMSPCSFFHNLIRKFSAFGQFIGHKKCIDTKSLAESLRSFFTHKAGSLANITNISNA